MSGERVDADGYVVTELNGELVQALDVDVFLGAGCVIRPGDVLLVSCDRGLDVGSVADVRQQLRDLLPALADVIVLGGGLRISGVYRDATSFNHEGIE